MAEIRVLDKQIADMIAAGEVVERPASAAKELIENSLDAGAREITVEIRRGGVTYLRVTDDGCGIPAKEVPIAFLRHATSKIHTEDDLEAISTLGFRGEALAALASVAHVVMLTKTREAPMGYSFTIQEGEILEQGEAGCPDGTTVVVRSIFFNVPVRSKFLKRDSAEGAALHTVVQRAALGHPEVAFRFIRDGEQVLSTPGDDSMEGAIYAVLGKEFARDTLLIRGSGENAAVTGYVTRPTACRGSRSHQFFFVNGRPVRSQLITAAVENAYRNQKMVGKFPGCVIHIATRYSTVDVNSHPNKTEVKFVRDKDIYDAVYYAVLQALGGEDDRPVLHLNAQGFVISEEPVQPIATLRELFSRGGGAEAEQIPEDSEGPEDPEESFFVFKPERGGGGYLPFGSPRTNSLYRADGPILNRSSYEAEEGPLEPCEGAPEEPWSNAPSQWDPTGGRTDVRDPEDMGDVLPPESPSEGREMAEEAIGETEAPPWRLVGEVMKTYLIVEQGEKVLFIDKHAAHERMNFNALKAQGLRAMSQELLSPVLCRLAPEEGEALLERRELLEELGFGVADGGSGELAVSRVPDFVSPGEVPGALSELARKLLTTGTLDPDSQRDELLHTMACKAAIKGGQRNDPAELLRVAQAVMDGSVRHCPHGRPVAAELTRGQLERQFKRA